MPVDDVAESDSLVPVFRKSFRRIVRCRVFEEPVSPRVRLFIRLQVFAGILLPLLVRIGYYRGSALSRRSSASLQRCLQFGSFVRVAGTPLTGNVKL